MKELVITLLEWIMSLGHLGIALGLMIEVIPSELVLSYGGYMVAKGHLNFTLAVIAGTIGGTLAQLFLYWMGHYGGRPFLEKYGRYILISKKQIDLSEKWFNKYGTGVIFFARFIPVVRHAISIPAGIAKMSFPKFTLYTTLAVIPWSIFFIELGSRLGSNWEDIKTIAAPYTRGIMIAAVLIIFLFILYKVKKKD
ncbi:DedA family protein [Fictibacillus phosphorivorans]|uniref:DedA family protein n=1 Tax=Fictibacillus phosphorivorans TaxID=1221500 RepID=UPI00203F1A3D|nr:DedA family protein [Fictibacillus phosphorivorans]MCM3718593.1 DedA family protein [Fictibacillus phosphorivorans]MCM3776216.1 DedA family protein [Fictibacillus phosphorivorans]